MFVNFNKMGFGVYEHSNILKKILHPVSTIVPMSIQYPLIHRSHLIFRPGTDLVSLLIFFLRWPLQKAYGSIVSNRRIGMKYGSTVLQYNQLMESDFWFDATLSRCSHDDISRTKVLPPGDWIQIVCQHL